MALFPEFAPEDWVFFLFIFGTLAVFSGAVGSYSDHWLINGAAQFYKIPIDVLFTPLFATGNGLLAVLALILFVMWVGKLIDLFTAGFTAAVIFGLMALTFGA